MLVSQVDATATLELLMVRFDNPASRREDGSYCDSGIFHLHPCDHIFTFSLDRGNRYEQTSAQLIFVAMIVLPHCKTL